MSRERPDTSARPRSSVGALLTLCLASLGAAGAALAQDPRVAPPAEAEAPPVGHEGTSGLAPLPGDARVPLAWLPPGAFADDRGPSPAIFPPQRLTIRFNHKLHVKELGVSCKTCHEGAVTSHSAADALTPSPTLCDACHGTDHADRDAVAAGTGDLGQCAFCHIGYAPGDGNRVARFEIPPPNLIFSHAKHAARNIGCQQCHGHVEELELATRDQLPRMRGCFSCHQHPDSAARGDAKSACETCHVKGGAREGGRIKTVFATGVLSPPRWMLNAEHSPDFIERHKYVAASDSQFCSNCHKEDECVACHDGRVRPRSVHPSDYLNMHAVEARLATQRCTSCHQEQSFCLGCHQRMGVTMSGPSAVREPGRFHPPKAIWSDGPRSPGHHGFEAMRNLNACVSCHIERDCVVCHGGQGIGGGFNPHRGGFAAECGTQLRRNPRPCYVCHDPGSSVLQMCR